MYRQRTRTQACVVRNPVLDVLTLLARQLLLLLTGAREEGRCESLELVDAGTAAEPEDGSSQRLTVVGTSGAAGVTSQWPRIRFAVSFLHKFCGTSRVRRCTLHAGRKKRIVCIHRKLY